MICSIIPSFAFSATASRTTSMDWNTLMEWNKLSAFQFLEGTLKTITVCFHFYILSSLSDF